MWAWMAVKAAETEHREDLTPSLWRMHQKKSEGKKIKLNASLYCSLSSLLKHFSLTALVLCFCTSPLSEWLCPWLPHPRTVTGDVSGAGQL